ncbi:MAG: hypothetical protein RLZZ213_1702 [Cyanobacteriota bacterium]
MPTPAYSCSKTFSGYPCCHRQWRHQGHCRFVHGYSRSFSFWFRATELDDCGFVVDFSSLKQLEARLADQFVTPSSPPGASCTTRAPST